MRIILGLLVLILLICIFSEKNSGTWRYLTERNPQKKILRDWLNKRDPELFKSCKVFFDENMRLQDVPMKQEGDYSLITAVLCGNDTKFWINNETDRVECYISYCGKNIGNKYCGNEIAENLCEQ